MEYPDDATLIARGKYSTLGKERRAQLDRVQTIAKTIMHLANPLLKDCESQPPEDIKPLKGLQDCIRNAEKARDKLLEVCAKMEELKLAAWPE